MLNDIKKLALLLRQSKSVLVFSGAGISTESGIPDFRSETGLWRKMDPALLSVDALRTNPKDFFRNYENFVALGRGKKPNTGHFMLAELEKDGFIKGIATQNVDGLHQTAGSKNVIEVHGHTRECCCMKCGRVFDYAVITEQLTAEREPKSQCCNALLRPTITLFGDRMPDDFDKLMRSINHYDFCLVVGSSLTVSPANSIPLSIERFAIINKESTFYDCDAELVLHMGIGDALEKLCGAIKES